MSEPKKPRKRTISGGSKAAKALLKQIRDAHEGDANALADALNEAVHGRKTDSK